MTRSTSSRVYRRQVKKGLIGEIKRRTGRDATTSSEVRKLIRERIAEKERENATLEIPEEQS